MQGIYYIKNILTDRIYIGQSILIERRIGDHCKKARNKELHNDMKNLGLDKFEWGVLELVEDRNDLTAREQYYIDLHIDNIYNRSKKALASYSGDLDSRSLAYQRSYKKKLARGYVGSIIKTE